MHDAGYQKGRQAERLALRVECARRLWDAETSRRWRDRWPALTYEAWPSLRDLRTVARERRGPMQIIDARRLDWGSIFPP